MSNIATNMPVKKKAHFLRINNNNKNKEEEEMEKRKEVGKTGKKRVMVE